MEREAENRSVTVLKGVGPKTAAAFLRLGISTIGDLSHHYPVRFEFYPEISPELPETGEGPVALLLTPDAPLSVIRKGRFCLTQGQFSGACGRLRLVWYNMPYLKKALKTGESKVYLGRIRRKDGKAVLEQPTIFSEEKYAEMTGRPVPVYPLTEGLSAAKMREAVREALSLLKPGVKMICVLKADGYGLGAAEVGQTLWEQGARHFAVACFTEARELIAALPEAFVLVLGRTADCEM